MSISADSDFNFIMLQITTTKSVFGFGVVLSNAGALTLRFQKWNRRAK